MRSLNDIVNSRCCIAVFFCLALLILTSCAGEETRQGQSEVEALYKNTLKLTSIYTDSIRMASDSAAVESAFASYNAAMDSLNMSVMANLDLLLDVTQNDTILQKMNVLLELRKHKLELLGKRAMPDTIPVGPGPAEEAEEDEQP